jgi:hypothetical protein
MEEVKKQGVESLFVPYEIALALKELGFDEPCLLYIIYVQDEDAVTKIPYKPEIYIDGYTPKFKYDYNEECLMTELKDTLKYKVTLKIPTFSQAFRWFREKYNMRVWVEWGSEYLCLSVIQYNSGMKECINSYSNDEEAELACLIKLIEIVKKK